VKNGLRAPGFGLQAPIAMRRLILSMLATIAFAARAASAEDVGAIAAAEPTADIGRDGEWIAAAPGAVVRLGDTLRTTSGGRLRVVFRDDSVITLAEDTELAIDEQVYQPAEGTLRSALRLLHGKMRALVGDEYARGGSAFEVRTIVGTSGVRGTDFIALYDERREVMEVVGVSGRVAVSSPLALVGAAVTVTEREMSAVARGKLPTAPMRLDDAVFRQYLEGLEFIGAGRAESLAFGGPLLTGDAIAEGDRAISLPPGAPPRAFSVLPGEPVYTTPDVSTLIGEPPLAVNGDAGLGVRF
jgi:hypothetical protein